MSKLDDRLAARSQQATDAAKAVASNGAGTPATATMPSETSAESPAAPAKPARPARPARTLKAAEAPAEISKGMRNQWRTNLQNAALKLAADRVRLDESEQAWADTVAQARTLGIPANVILSAAAYADVELLE